MLLIVIYIVLSSETHKAQDTMGSESDPRVPADNTLKH